MTDISIRGLTKRFGGVTAVRDLSFDVGAGEVTGFLGPNGAGKTTTLRMLLGLVRPTAGTATIGGARYADLPYPRQVVGAVLEATGFHPGRTGREHLRILARLTRGSAGSGWGPRRRRGVGGAAGSGWGPRRRRGVGGAAGSGWGKRSSGLDERVDEVLEQVSLTGDAGRRVGGYSLGMRQRLGLASALLGDPEVLVLDEPANGLDPAGMAWLRGLLRDLAAEGRTVLISSHVLAEVAQTVDRVVIISEGSMRYAGAPHADLESAFLELTS